MERDGGTKEVLTNLDAAIKILTHYYYLLDSIPNDVAFEEGEVAAGKYLQSHMLSGQFNDSEIAMAHMAVDREAWGETGYQRRIARK